MSGLYSTARWRRLRASFREDSRLRQLPCGICHQPINYALTYPDPGSWQADHREPFKDRPDLFFSRANLQPAHKRCNESRHAAALDTTWITPKW